MPASPATCRICQATYPDEATCALHMGQQHEQALTEAEQAAYHRADARELETVATLARHVRGALATLPVVAFYGLIVMVGIVERLNPGLIALPLPGVLLTCAFLYYLGYIHDQDPSHPGRAGPDHEGP